ncbi:Uncharacterised 5xTM membrane BCR, YitT family COG1284 [Rhodoferax sp. OV413]|uniref:YitT family protein n=1 Tax=Rhodoferax sp. OV413 TaxID=1855285 RepID=UPI000889601A|nr:YitT family protein [Rhodoferax sp. OV413]SDO30697.1 Uncharacterised 5xTM membrane BCR, YitT family COG1284 [Rhodoferax sp. OV413]
MPAAPADSLDSSIPHSATEDLLALVSGTLLVSLGLSMFTHVGLLPGGTAGIAMLLHYGTGLNFGLLFFLLNLPFSLLAWRRMGWAFTLKSLAAVALLSLMTNLTGLALHYADLQPLYAAIAGGLVLGTGFLVLFRHRASLGGIGVLAAYLQETRGWRAGHVQMAVDICILVAALVMADPARVAYSVLGALVLNAVLAVNHRPGRYMGT